jgi:hypothetical protein
MELFDLNALAEAALADDRFADLPHAIRQASSMSSVKNDLGRATEMLNACKLLQSRMSREANEGKPVDREEAATVQALFAQAVFLYTRAAHSKGAARNKLQITNSLTEPLREVHDRITVLRDRYLAHFGEPGDWERHRTVLALDVDAAQMALSYPHESYYVRAEESQDLETLLEAARSIAQQAYVLASERLNLILNRLFDEVPDFLQRLRSHPFAPKSFFDEDQVGGYLAGIGNRDPDPFTAPRVRKPAKLES